MVVFGRPVRVPIVDCMDAVAVPSLVAFHMVDAVAVVARVDPAVRPVVAVAELVAAVVADHSYLRNDVVVVAVDATTVATNSMWV